MKLFHGILMTICLAGCCSPRTENDNPPCDLVANDKFLQSCLVFRTTTNWVERNKAAIQCFNEFNAYLYTGKDDLTFGGVQALIGKGMRYKNKENELIYHVPTEEYPNACLQFIYYRPEIVSAVIYMGWVEY